MMAEQIVYCGVYVHTTYYDELGPVKSPKRVCPLADLESTKIIIRRLTKVIITRVFHDKMSVFFYYAN